MMKVNGESRSSAVTVRQSLRVSSKELELSELRATHTWSANDERFKGEDQLTLSRDEAILN